MHSQRFDEFLRAISAAPSRRAIVRSVSGLALAGSLSALLGFEESLAKKKRKKKKKRRRRSAHVPPPGPTTTDDAACAAASSTGVVASRRVAQTFRALRGGQLTRARVVLAANPEGADFDLEIWDVDVRGAPTTVLASTAIANVPATSRTGPAQTLTGVFVSPAAVEAGQRYALVVNESWTSHVGFHFLLQVNHDDPCPDGNLFHDAAASGTFTPDTESDLVFATFVTA